MLQPTPFQRIVPLSNPLFSTFVFWGGWGAFSLSTASLPPYANVYSLGLTTISRSSLAVVLGGS
jgi:hypothetical protein